MALLYDRNETPDEIVITFKYQAAWYIFLLLAFLLIPATNQNQLWQIAFGAVVIVAGLTWIISKRQANKEITQAMKHGQKVEVSGNRFSFKNPITYRIKKTL